MNEEFKVIDECPNYMVSNFGNIKGLTSGIILKPWFNDRGYNKVTLCKSNNKQSNRYVHRLVAIAFIENPHQYNQVNHIDGNKNNNTIHNLEWCTRKHNITHARDILNSFQFLKDKPIARKLNVNQVINIKQLLKLDSSTKHINKIASEYNVNPQTIKCIHWGITWKGIE
jgi:hypothetical protein